MFCQGSYLRKHWNVARAKIQRVLNEYFEYIQSIQTPSLNVSSRTLFSLYLHTRYISLFLVFSWSAVELPVTPITTWISGTLTPVSGKDEIRTSLHRCPAVYKTTTTTFIRRLSTTSLRVVSTTELLLPTTISRLVFVTSSRGYCNHASLLVRSFVMGTGHFGRGVQSA